MPARAVRIEPGSIVAARFSARAKSAATTTSTIPERDLANHEGAAQALSFRPPAASGLQVADHPARDA